MMGRRIAVVGSLLIALVSIPRPSEAGLLELIWEMSGPRMLGFGYGCMYSPRTQTWVQCRSNPLLQARNTATEKGPFFVLGGSILASTGRDSDTQSYDWGEIWMVALQPGVAVRSYENATKTVQVHHAVGVEYDVLFGRDIRRFDKFAMTVTLVDVSYKKVTAGLKYRLYPNGFTDDEFKPGPRESMDRPFEAVLGFTFGVIFKE
jgi:hypothetical protein